MFHFLIKKIINSFFVLLGVIAIVFFLFFVILPADPARLTMGQRSDAKSIANIRKELYLDKPLPQQFLLYLNDLSPIAIHEKSDETREKYNYTTLISVSDKNNLVLKSPYLRRSYQTKKEVNEMLLDAFPGTLILASLSILIASIIGIFLGTIAALKQNTWLDTSVIFSSILGISVPSFFAGILMAYIFGFLLKDYTGLSIVSPMWDYDPFTGRHFVLKSLILPVLTLSIRPIAIIVQITRSSMLDVLNQDYIRTAYAKGLTKKMVVWRHALRNALNPVITSISGWFAELLAGSFFIEYIFGWKGLGKITVDALNKFDFPVVMGSVLFTALIFIIMNILVDILYTVVDPRIKM
ncbi:MAG TPA: ABC transporter permease [Chitinophagaceae bacterium]|nr:ABC transporter permease [Chitinophagaceae bacterium]